MWTLSRDDQIETRVAEGNRFSVPLSQIEIVDALAPNRVAGKVYVYPNGTGWEVSGHYRRGETDRWHPFLMALDDKVELISLMVRDNDVATLAVAAAEPKFSVSQYSN